MEQPNGPLWKLLITYSSDLHELTHMRFTVGLHSVGNSAVTIEDTGGKVVSI